MMLKRLDDGPARFNQNAGFGNRRSIGTNAGDQLYLWLHRKAARARAARRETAAFLYGLPEMPIEDISLSDISISLSPNAEAGYPEMADNMEQMQRAGLFVRNARKLRLHDVEVMGQLGPALMLADSTDVDIRACTTRTPCADAALGTAALSTAALSTAALSTAGAVPRAVIRMSNVDGAFVHGCQASAGTEVFLQAEGETTQGIVFSGNDLSRARQPITLAENVHSDVAIV